MKAQITSKTHNTAKTTHTTADTTSARLHYTGLLQTLHPPGVLPLPRIPGGWEGEQQQQIKKFFLQTFKHYDNTGGLMEEGLRCFDLILSLMHAGAVSG